VIRARGTTADGRPLILLGLSDENLRRLREGGDEGWGEPIAFRLDSLGGGLPPASVIIMAGPDEETMRDRLASCGLRPP